MKKSIKVAIIVSASVVAVSGTIYGGVSIYKNVRTQTLDKWAIELVDNEVSEYDTFTITRNSGIKDYDNVFKPNYKFSIQYSINARNHCFEQGFFIRFYLEENKTDYRESDFSYKIEEESNLPFQYNYEGCD